MCSLSQSGAAQRSAHHFDSLLAVSLTIPRRAPSHLHPFFFPRRTICLFDYIIHIYLSIFLYAFPSIGFSNLFFYPSIYPSIATPLPCPSPLPRPPRLFLSNQVRNADSASQKERNTARLENSSCNDRL